MATIIPSYYDPNIKSTAEIKIFNLLKGMEGTEEWFVLHSLALREHINQRFGEIDFLVLIPNRGIIVLEVKGGRVRREAGRWIFTDRMGNETIKVKGPFEQARDAMFSLKKIIGDHFKNDQLISNVFFDYLVCFPDIVFDSHQADIEADRIVDLQLSDLKKAIANRFGLNKRQELTFSVMKKIKDYLRGDFDIRIPFKRVIDATEENLIKLTEEQYDVLEKLSDNSRIIVQGFAGTGKTQLAIEAVKEFTRTGNKVAFFCFNKNLAEWLTYHFKDEVNQPSFIGTFHQFMRKQAEKSGKNITYSPSETFFETILPSLAIAGIQASEDKFDRIVIDEAQDIINPNNVLVLDEALKRGLENGKWLFFGDFIAQSIYENRLTSEDMFQLINPKNNITQFRLNINCRNTQQISREIKNVTGIESLKLLKQVQGEKVDYFSYQTPEEQISLFETKIQELLQVGVPKKSITILSPYKFENSIVSRCSSAIKHLITLDLFSSKVAIAFCTIHAFKGLESPIVILVDIDDYRNDKLSYVALSRARSKLIVFESTAAKKMRFELLATSKD